MCIALSKLVTNHPRGETLAHFIQSYRKPCSVKGYMTSHGSFISARISQVQALYRLRPQKRFVWAHTCLSRQILVFDGFLRVRMFKVPTLAPEVKQVLLCDTDFELQAPTPVARAHQSPHNHVQVRWDHSDAGTDQ